MDKTDKEKKWELKSAKEKNEQNPETFHIPSREEINDLEIGHFVKLIFNEVGEELSERMWVEIKDIWEGETYVGDLNNEPVIVPGIKFGDKVMFRAEHIAGTLEPESVNKKEDITSKLKEAKEYELFFFIDQCGMLLWKLQHNMADSRVELTLEEKQKIEQDVTEIITQQRDAVNIAVEKFNIELVYEETTDIEGNKTEEIVGEYWTWFNHWKEWLNSFSEDEWQKVRQKMESNQSIEEYLPKKNWNH